MWFVFLDLIRRENYNNLYKHLFIFCVYHWLDLHEKTRQKNEKTADL